MKDALGFIAFCLVIGGISYEMGNTPMQGHYAFWCAVVVTWFAALVGYAVREIAGEFLP